MKNIERNIKIHELIFKITTLQKILNALVDTCPHDITKNGINPYNLSIRMHELLGNIPVKESLILKGSESAICWICGRDFGWYCPKSPYHICNYYHNGEDGLLGTYPDDCVYCHQPKERK